MINSVLKREHIKKLEDEFNFLNKIGYGDLNYEALYKWACVMYNVKKTGLLKQNNDLNFVEIGGGLSPVQFYFSNFAKVTNIEIWVRGIYNTWFPTEKDLLYSKCIRDEFRFNRDNITFLKEHFYNFANRQQSNSFDLVYDCCSAIHINRNKKEIEFVFPEFLKHVHRILKPGGFFIATMDIMHPSNKEYKEFLHIETLLNMINNSDLNLVSEYDSNIEDFFLDLEKLHKPVNKTDICYKSTKGSCSMECKNLPEEHLLFDGSGNKIFLRASFVLRKE